MIYPPNICEDFIHYALKSYRETYERLCPYLAHQGELELRQCVFCRSTLARGLTEQDFVRDLNARLADPEFWLDYQVALEEILKLDRMRLSVYGKREG